MERENAKNGIGYMIMMFTMISEIQMVATPLFVQYLEDLAPIPTPEGLEPVENQLEKVGSLPSSG